MLDCTRSVCVRVHRGDRLADIGDQTNRFPGPEHRFLTRPAVALVRADCVDALAKLTNIGGDSTLVNVDTSALRWIARRGIIRVRDKLLETNVTDATLEAAMVVDAKCLLRTAVSSLLTLVNINAKGLLVIQPPAIVTNEPQTGMAIVEFGVVRRTDALVGVSMWLGTANEENDRGSGNQAHKSVPPGVRLY